MLSAVDIFKATHNSTKHGFSEDVQVAIVSNLPWICILLYALGVKNMDLFLDEPL